MVFKFEGNYLAPMEHATIHNPFLMFTDEKENTYRRTYFKGVTEASCLTEATQKIFEKYTHEICELKIKPVNWTIV